MTVDDWANQLVSARTRSLRRGILCLAWLAIAMPVVQAGDWPQILGPNRNGVAVEERIAVTSLNMGPKTLWQYTVGSGFAGVAVNKGNVILFHRIGDEEIVEALSASTGKPVWKSAIPTGYRPSYTDDNGPRAVPIVTQGRVYVYGASGYLRCLDVTTGKSVWERDTYKDFNSKKEFHGEPAEGYFGIASSPIIEGDKIVVNIGGDRETAGIGACGAGT
jgi:outer membrane protein assembly factor BamB